MCVCVCAGQRRGLNSPQSINLTKNGQHEAQLTAIVQAPVSCVQGSPSLASMVHENVLEVMLLVHKFPTPARKRRHVALIVLTLSH